MTDFDVVKYRQLSYTHRVTPGQGTRPVAHVLIFAEGHPTQALRVQLDMNDNYTTTLVPLTVNRIKRALEDLIKATPQAPLTTEVTSTPPESETDGGRYYKRWSKAFADYLRGHNATDGKITPDEITEWYTTAVDRHPEVWAAYDAKAAKANV